VKQDYPPEKFQVIVVNDGSTDATADIFSQMNLPENFRLAEHPENCGLAAARNTGIRRATGEILIFLDSDMEVARDFISRHIVWYDRPEVVGVVSELCPAPENPYDKYQLYLYDGRRGARMIGADRALPFQYFIFGLTSIRRSALDSIGGFDAGIRHYGGEDTEMAFRLWQKYPEGLFFDSKIRVIHHHYRPFPLVLKTVEDFSRQVLPYLAEKDPAIAAQYGGSYFRKKSDDKPSSRHWIGRFWRTDFVFRTLWFLYTIVPYPLANYLVRFFLGSAFFRGRVRS